MFLFRPGNLIKITRETFIEAFESQNNSDDLHKHPKDAREAGYFKINTGKAQTKQLGGSGLEIARIYLRGEYQWHGFVMFGKHNAIWGRIGRWTG